MSAQTRLLNWCKQQTDGYAGVTIDNFHLSWRSGVVHSLDSSALNFDTISPANPIANHNLAFDLAHTRLGISKLLDADDMMEGARPEQFSVMTYIGQFFKKFGSSARPALNRTNTAPVLVTAEKQKQMDALQDVRTRFGVGKKDGDDDGDKPRRALNRTVSTSVVVDPSKMTASQALRAKKAGDSFKPRTAAKDDLIQKCHASGTPLTGIKAIDWNGNQYHPDHFLCTTCKTKLGKNIVNVANEPYCDKCGRKAFVRSKIKTKADENKGSPAGSVGPKAGQSIADAYEAEERVRMKKTAEDSKNQADTDESKPAESATPQKSSIPAWKLKLMERSAAAKPATITPAATPAATPATATLAATPAADSASTYSCTNCKSVNPINVKFCQDCGARAAEPAADKSATDKAAADKAAAEKAATEKAAAEKAASEKAAADKVAAEKAAALSKSNAEKAAADKAASDKAAADKAAADKAAAERAASLSKSAADKAASEKAAADKAAADKLAAAKSASDKAAADKAVAERSAADKAATDKANADRLAAEKKAQEAEKNAQEQRRRADEAAEKVRLEQAAKLGLQAEADALKSELAKLRSQLTEERTQREKLKELKENEHLKVTISDLKEENQRLKQSPPSQEKETVVTFSPPVRATSTTTVLSPPPVKETVVTLSLPVKETVVTFSPPVKTASTTTVLSPVVKTTSTTTLSPKITPTPVVTPTVTPIVTPVQTSSVSVLASPRVTTSLNPGGSTPRGTTSLNSSAGLGPKTVAVLPSKTANMPAWQLKLLEKKAAQQAEAAKGK